MSEYNWRKWMQPGRPAWQMLLVLSPEPRTVSELDDLAGRGGNWRTTAALLEHLHSAGFARRTGGNGYRRRDMTPRYALTEEGQARRAVV